MENCQLAQNSLLKEKKTWKTVSLLNETEEETITLLKEIDEDMENC